MQVSELNFCNCLVIFAEFLKAGINTFFLFIYFKNKDLQDLKTKFYYILLHKNKQQHNKKNLTLFINFFLSSSRKK
jgi:hypothetical protein